MFKQAEPEVVSSDVLGSALPTTQRRVLALIVPLFKAALVTGVLLLVARGVGTLSSAAEIAHDAMSIALAGAGVAFLGLHVWYALALRGGHVYRRTRWSGVLFCGVVAAVVAAGLSHRLPAIESSNLLIALHVGGALLIPLFFQTHRLRASVARGD